ncbi:deoxynucleoside triphosphate triphosphohydrolase SAMHD1-like [Saccostrea echinata]|uniref:deoxynucleoside triphosphate triphosphohydrolase SAMHD1-like n=1 Tax=Saccostrea echinata TaxID=191078 RepID=UPI002A81E5C2|nr:deoxynucleoside triphosphate triphosphohydrolase SAMHD1-like [Saccostrea echinata]
MAIFIVLQIINDSIWGPIELSPTSWKIINTPEFQRLRFIKQLGGCYFVYPGACHNRFEHSIGTAHLARTLGTELQKNQPELKITQEDIICLEVAGLCHDLGHGAFSHLFDLQFIQKARPGYEWEHEEASLKMLDRIFEIVSLDDLTKESQTFIKELIKKPKGSYEGRPKEKHFLYEVVANDVNKIDVDKWDYFSRDCHMLGLHHNFQCQRSIKIARVIEHGGERHISFPKSEYLNIFDMFSTRYTLHRQAYQHPANRVVQTMISDAFIKADRYLTFPPNKPKGKSGKTLSESIDDMDAYIWVTDDVFHRIRTLSEDNENVKQAKTILDRILSRDFYKIIGEKKVQFKGEKQKVYLKEKFQYSYGKKNKEQKVLREPIFNRCSA